MADRRNDPTLQTHTPSPTVAEDDAPARPSAVTVGTRLGRYTIIKLLGRGGMGAVYEADDPELDRRVAIKLLRDDRSGLGTEGLRREAQALARLVHQNVVMVYDVGVADDQVFLVMQLVEGETLDVWLARQKPTTAEIIAKFHLAGAGLIGAHAAGLVHCDFKPANVLIDARGDVRVSDFGLARATHETSITHAASLTPIVDMTTVAGTPAYMAPEQFTGVVTAASDQFAFCCALWECLAGERPFVDSKVPVLDVKARGARKSLPRDANVPRYMVRALERGMADDPSGRFPTMTALLAALEPPRRWIHIAASAAGVGLLAGGVIAYFAFGQAPKAMWDAADVANSKPLTSFGTQACAYAPTVDRGGKLVVFDRTAGDAVDLYEVPITGGEHRALTSAATWEWRAQPGRRPGEVVHLIHDQDDPKKSMVAVLDRATLRETSLVQGLIWDAVLVGDTLYYSPDAMAGIRTLRGSADRQFVQPPAGRSFMLIGASPRGDRLAVTTDDRNGGPTRPCIIDLASASVDCLPHDSPARPVFGTDGSALYLATYDGIIRRDLATGEVKTVVGVYAEGGLAIPPDGSALIYSTCTSHDKLVDTSTGQTLVDDTVVGAATSSTGGLAWIQSLRGSHVLFARLADGRDTQLTTAALGNVAGLRFSPDGKRIVFGTGQPHPGLRVVDVERAGQISQLTEDARDQKPVWTTAGLVAFTQSDIDGNEQIFVMPADGGTPRRLGNSTRTVYGSRGKDLLVGGNDAMYWLDPETGIERPGPRRPDSHLHSATTSPAGTWVVYQMGPTGQELWRVRVDPPGELERIVTYAAGETVIGPTIRDDGHILAAVGKWYGDLIRIPARPGTRF